MSKRNIAWLIVIVAVCVLVWINAGALWGILAAVATLVASEAFERARRKRRRAARGATDAPSVGDAVDLRRRRR